MKTSLKFLAAGTALCASTAWAAGIAMDDQSQLKPAPAKPAGETYFQPPAEDSLPANAYGDLVREGHDIFVNTGTHAAEYVGNGLACTNCHLDQGRRANSAPLWAAYTMYPAYRKKNNKVNSFAERMQGCFQFSMNGKPPAADSHVIAALTAYAYWMSKGAPTGVALPGRAYAAVPQPKGGYDIAKGAKVYEAQCTVCHGADGEGQKAADGKYVFPPLWGAASYNWGAGMHRINTAAAFIKHNMPLGRGGLSDEDAWNVAAFVNSHERPQDPRLVEGSIEKTRVKYHANDGVNLYGQTVNGVLLGQGVKQD